MRERCEQLGGYFHVWSEADMGTEVELRIPPLWWFGLSPERTPTLNYYSLV
jgi:hypothetical protein